MTPLEIPADPSAWMQAIRGPRVLGLAGSIVLCVTVLVAGISAPVDASSTGYGPGVGADALANTVVGGRWGTKASYRFKAKATAKLKAVRVYIMGDGAGYGSGTGGQLRITIRPDDRSAARRPSGKILAKTLANRPATDAGVRVVFDDPPKLKKGKRYHVVFENVDPRSDVNYVSLNGLYAYGKSDGWQPAYPRKDWGQLTKQPGGAWKNDGPSDTTTPIMALAYANGARQGIGYMEVWSHAPRDISGSARVSEVFRVRGGGSSITKVLVRLKRISGTSPLRVRIQDGSGRWLGKGTIAAARFPTSSRSSSKGGAWATAELDRVVRLEKGKRYRLVLTSDPDTTYVATAIRKGASYGYGQRTYYSHGHAEFSTGSGWQPFKGWGEPSVESDLQFYLR